ncbi:MAG: LysM peptidoglycan-binding domain-containing protein [Phycisphaeraceae bacterium]|nr:LysM peptidoglycan-binding domain-containing protein [Phycisphaeraceae bacterium]MCW5753504.1 LysM peptidoglycan-binding domain-containing protein [Phycisphaeraceae bacterium]
MTRETKFALIIGFTLILVVGVLITDHFSGANRAPVADLSGMGTATEPIPATTGQAASPTRQAHRDSPTPIEPRPLVQIDQSRSSWAPETDRTADPVRQPVQEQPVSRPVQIDQVDPLRSNPAFTPVDDARRPLNDPLIPREREPSTTPAQPRTAPPADNTLWHTVQNGESLYSIARKHYGDGNVWRRIAEANPQRIGPNNTVRPGVRLIIPGVTVNEPVRPDAPTATPPAGTNTGQPGARAETASDTRSRTYTVKSGDSLSTIAQRELGSVTRMPELLALNKDKISDPDDIWVGLVLRLPQGSSTQPTAQPPAPASGRPAPSASSSARTYVVKEGDSLAKIARTLLGSADRVDDLMIANPSIKDENKIFAGMVLNIPAR